MHQSDSLRLNVEMTNEIHKKNSWGLNKPLFNERDYKNDDLRENGSSNTVFEGFFALR